MSKSALIIVDMVRDFTDPEGLVYYPQNREILPQIRKVLDKCREKGVLVVFMQHCNRKGKVDRKSPGNEAKLHRRHLWSGDRFNASGR